jgi:sugar phosphate isomerase/epimerase
VLELAIAVHPRRTGGVALPRYLEQLAALGIGAVELRYPDAPDDQLVIAAARQIHKLGLRCHLHGPRPAHHMTRQPPDPRERWRPVVELAAELAARQGAEVHLVLHPAGGPDDRLEEYRQRSAELARWILEAPGVAPMLELSGPHDGTLLGRMRRWWLTRGAGRRSIGPPPGTIRPGLAGQRLSVRRPGLGEEDEVEPCAGEQFSAGAGRAALLATREAIGDERAGLCWDLGHDWLHGQRLERWTTVPEQSFLRAVRHVHLHEALPDGQLHLPLLTGNVPYTTQLRALLASGFEGVVTLEILFGRAALQLGERMETLRRSVQIARQALRLQPRPALQITT